MHPSLRKDTLRRSLRSILFVVAACLLVWLWGNHHKVDVDIEFTVELTDGKPVDMSLSFYDKDNTFMQELSIPVHRDLGKANYRLALKPGDYTVRGIVQSENGKKHAVEQTLHIPNDNAQMFVYLRDH